MPRSGPQEGSFKLGIFQSVHYRVTDVLPQKGSMFHCLCKGSARNSAPETAQSTLAYMNPPYTRDAGHPEVPIKFEFAEFTEHNILHELQHLRHHVCL